MFMRNSGLKVVALMAALVGWLACPARVTAQTSLELINITGATWRYLADGTDQGTAWRDKSFNDATWSTGRALIGFESTPAEYPYPFNTIYPNNGTVLNNQ